MAKIIQNGNGDSKKYSIVGLNRSEFFTLLDILDGCRVKAGNLQDKTYSDNEAEKILKLCSVMHEELGNIIKI